MPKKPRRQPTDLPYTKADIQRWKTDMLLKRPTTRHTGDMRSGVQAVSFDIDASANGLRILVVNAHGEELPILMNPVLAAALRDGIFEIGQKSGWLAQDGTPIPAIE